MAQSGIATATAALPRRGRSKTILFRTICVTTSVVLALGVAEMYVRCFGPVVDCWTVAQLESTAADKKLPFTFDRELGFRPVLGVGSYTAEGTIHNGYALEKPPGACRVLFLGDSVTVRGSIIDAVAAIYGTSGFEYWNAGVEAYDASQEVLFFQRYNYRVRPDQVVLTFHNNDFTPQTVADFDDDGCMTFYGADCTLSVRLPWLLRHSELVRLALAARFRWQARASDRVEHALQSLAHTLAADDIPLSVILLPIMERHDDWSAKEKTSRERAIAIFKKLDIRYFDVLPAVEQALNDGIEVCGSPGDTWHPSAAVCGYLVRQLQDEGLLDRAGPGCLAARDSDAADESRH